MHTTCIKSRWWHRAVEVSCWFVSYFVCTAHQHSLELLDQYQFGNQSGAVAADALITKLQARLTLRHTANILWINWSSTSSSSPSSPSLNHWIMTESKFKAIQVSELSPKDRIGPCQRSHRFDCHLYWCEGILCHVELVEKKNKKQCNILSFVMQSWNIFSVCYEGLFNGKHPSYWRRNLSKSNTFFCYCKSLSAASKKNKTIWSNANWI